MTLRIVNTAPGDIADLLLPGKPLTFGLRSETGTVVAEEIFASLGISRLHHITSSGTAVLPENNPNLPTVYYDTAEHARPLGATTPVVPSGALLALGPGSGVGYQVGTYEVHFPVESSAVIFGTVTFRLRAWSEAARYWCDRTALAPLYFGLEHGVVNTGVFGFLRNDGAGGSVVVGGPLHAAGGVRGNEQEYTAVRWKNLAAGTSFTLGFVIDPLGNTQIYAQGVLLGSFSTGLLGHFEPATSPFWNRRTGPSTEGVFYFGLAGDNADVLEVVDYAMYQSFPPAMSQSSGAPGFATAILPDLPVRWTAGSNKLPHTPDVGRWLPLVAGQSAPVPWYQPGRKSAPLYISYKKNGVGIAGFKKREPRLSFTGDGFSAEGWIAGDFGSVPALISGAGFYADDGVNLFSVDLALISGIKTVAIRKNSIGAAASDFYLALDSGGMPRLLDWSAPLFVRLSVDKRRGRVLLFVEDMDTPAIDVPLAGTFPSSAGSVEFGAGHVSALDCIGSCNVGYFSYLNRYTAWEHTDHLLPDNVGINAAARMVWSAVGSTATAGWSSGSPASLVIEKSDFGSIADHFAYYVKSIPQFAMKRGVQLDFRCRVVTHTTPNGLLGGPNCWTGAGVNLFLGELESPLAEFRQLQLGFFDCGAFGKRIGIIPRSGTVDDVIEQTALGQRFSAPVDWSNKHSYRLVYQPFKSIDLWVDSFLASPVISVPWELGSFDVPIDRLSRAPGVAFGHFSSEAASKSEWEFFRWGTSTGYDVAITPTPPADLTSWFGGRAYLSVDANEVP